MIYIQYIGHIGTFLGSKRHESIYDVTDSIYFTTCSLLAFYLKFSHIHDFSLHSRTLLYFYCNLSQLANDD